jgi:endonuclease/exonuclease/phosphatase family metal-dependent hydrolase
LIAAAVLSSGCMGGHTLVRQETAALGVTWFAPDRSDDRLELARWRRSVGPPVVRSAPRVAAYQTDALTVINWNTALGGGDVTRLVESVRRRIGREAPLVLLLQEVYRRGEDVPAKLGPDAEVAGRLGTTAPNGRRDDVAALATALELGAWYVPSMRNGAPSESDEDRGNAILSNLPLAELAAIELPFERQRRVAVAATVSGTTARGMPWTLRVVSAHLDNMVGARRGWIAGGEYARARQARGLVALLGPHTATLLGGDFNTWFGFSDQAYVETARAFPQTRVSDRRPTFLGLLRLDHLFFRLPEGWRAEFRREHERYGSDHYPLVATIRF